MASSCKEDAKSNKETPTSSSDITLYYGGDINTMEGEEAQYAEAVVQQDGKIAFVGTLAAAEKQFPKATKNDLKGKTLYLDLLMGMDTFI